jgi:RNA polymerase sigma-70 factor (ECF subfamily)
MDSSLEVYANDGDALRALKQKQPPALRALLAKYESPLIGYLKSITYDHALAEDLTQETFLKLIRRPPLMLSQGSLKPWLFKVARNLAIDQLRAGQRIEVRETVPDASEAHQRHAALDSSDTELLLQSLPTEMRQIVALRIFADFTFKEIAKHLKMPLGTVLWKMTQATQHMRQKLEADES